ncbi:MFS transporter [Paenibacillus sp. LHD-38]|uniref:MFS transporter n=1 Tax=Paenibacillus sp. LHD-38 TaxID=3072143 RepID=UPI00280CCB8C|nr:MFS transporter [Paenibacillus sp. LHD-38]MDQ8737174.1 MFS transporter [Paenibacillus sp. LHD-38]
MRIKPNKIKAETKVKLVAAITAVCLLGDTMLYVVLPIFGEQFGIQSLWQVGVLLSMNRFVRIPIHPLIGWFYSKYQIKMGIIIAILLTVMSTFCYGWLNGFWMLLIARCVWGVAWAFLKQGGQLQVVAAIEENSENGGRLSGIYNSITGIGALLGMLVGGFVSTFYGPDNILIAFAVLAFLTLFFVGRLEGSAFVEIQHVEKQRTFNKELISLMITGFILTLIFQGFLKSTMSYWVGMQNYEWIPFMQAIGAATITGLLITVKLSLDPLLVPWIGKINDRSINGNRYLTILTIVASSLLFLFPMRMNVVICLGMTMLLLLISTVLMTINDAKIFQQSTAHNRHKVISGYSMASDLGAAAGPLFGFLFISLIGDIATAWVASLLLVVGALSEFMMKKLHARRSEQTLNTTM